MKGRKMKPQHLKVLHGTAKKSNKNKKPHHSQRKPHPPSYLSSRGKQIFRMIVGRLEEVGTCSATYTEIIAIYARVLEDVETLSKQIDEVGQTYETTSTAGDKIQKAHPAVRMLSDVRRHAQSLAAELGLSPLSSAKVPKGKPNGNKFDGL